jgi:hypothetical protein
MKTPAPRWLYRTLWGFVCLVIAGCLTSSPARPPTKKAPDYPGILLDSHSLGNDFFWQQRVVASFKDKRYSFSAVLQLRQGKLTFLALTTMGRRAFALEQNGKAVHYTKYLPFAMPFPAEYILYDIHRIYFYGVDVKSPCDKNCKQIKNGERITESWNGGKLYAREYKRLNNKPSGVFRIRYREGIAGNRPPPHIEYENGWYGYKLSVVTIRAE